MIYCLVQSKYIASLKQVAERRKLEQEIIYERMVQRDMEKEGEKCEEKDTFLTSAYRKKLQERRLLEEELKMAAYREGVCLCKSHTYIYILSVCLQFYAHTLLFCHAYQNVL